MLALLLGILLCHSTLTSAQPVKAAAEEVTVLYGVLAVRPTGRHLLEYTCSAAQALSGQCASLCSCAAAPPGAAAAAVAPPAATAPGGDCGSLCEACVAAAVAGCPPDDSLPPACVNFTGLPGVQMCLSG